MKSHIVNVVDLELSCYPNDEFPLGERKEIIELGLTTVNLKTLAIVQSLSFPVIPTMSNISPYCTELTGWTEAKLRKQGTPFAEVMRRLESKHGAQNRLLVTDSNDELDTIRAQCALMGLPCPFGGGYLNLSTMLSVLTGDLRNVSLSEKLNLFGLEFEGVLHRGKDDSRNIARLLLAIREKAEIKFVAPGA
jgi:inhibitor of KinA sporulation pathway (predicted exonuclease)